MAKVTAKDREEHGIKSGKNEGKFPLATEAQCLSAVKLRHNGKGVSASSVLARCSAAAGKNGWERCKAAIKKAREVDKG